jgi:hypothetical protein
VLSKVSLSLRIAIFLPGAGLTSIHRGFTAGPEGGCYSNMPVETYTASTGCRRVMRAAAVTTVSATYTLYGTPVTRNVVSLLATATTESLFSVTKTFKPSEKTNFIGYTWALGATLIHKANETSLLVSSTSTSPPGATTSSAAVAKATISPYGVIGSLLLIWSVLAASGALLFVWH